MLHIDPKEKTVPEVHRLLLGGIAPRPIAFVSTVSTDGINNLSPFSFFNAFGANPPTVAFSPARRGRDGSFKDTYYNIEATRECVIQAVTYKIVHQVNLASTEYPPGTDEFTKSGLTPIKSDLVKPCRVKESPFQMECIVKEIVHLGNSNASGNLVICEVIRFHVDENILRDGHIHPDLIDLVGRNSAQFYTRASGDAVFEISKPAGDPGIGYNNLPDYIKSSNIYTANNLGQLGLVSQIPDEMDARKFAAEFTPLPATAEDIDRLAGECDFRKMLQVALHLIESGDPSAGQILERTAKAALDSGDISFGWNVAVLAHSVSKKEHRA